MVQLPEAAAWSGVWFRLIGVALTVDRGGRHVAELPRSRAGRWRTSSGVTLTRAPVGLAAGRGRPRPRGTPLALARALRSGLGRPTAEAALAQPLNAAALAA